MSLALGIDANTAIFSLIDAVMLKTLPVSHPEELLGPDRHLARFQFETELFGQRCLQDGDRIGRRLTEVCQLPGP